MISIRNINPGDYNFIVLNLSDFWGSDRTRSVHHPMYAMEFDDTSFVACINERVVAYIMGFVIVQKKLAYVHLIAVHQEFRKKGLGISLYNQFIERALELGCTQIKAITSTGNMASITFHRSLGMNTEGVSENGEFPVVRNYGGSGNERIVFTKPIE